MAKIDTGTNRSDDSEAIALIEKVDSFVKRRKFS
jgi:hypothetical protein